MSHTSNNCTQQRNLLTSTALTYILVSIIGLILFIAGLFVPLGLRIFEGNQSGNTTWMGAPLSDVSSYSQIVAATGAVASVVTIILALIALLREFREVKVRQAETQRQQDVQNATLASQLLIPIFVETRRLGKELRVVSTFWRHCLKECGYDPESCLSELKGSPDGIENEAFKPFQVAACHMSKQFASYRRRVKATPMWPMGEAATNGDCDPFCVLDSARREVSLIAQKVYQISRSGVSSPELLRISASAEFVAAYEYCVYPLDLAIERERNPIANEYPPGSTFIQIYRPAERLAALY